MRGRSWAIVLAGGDGNLKPETEGSPPSLLKSALALRRALAAATGIFVVVLGALAWNLVELPDGRLAAVGDQVVIVSPDHGATWRAVGPAIPFPPTGFAYSPVRKAFYAWYFGCDQTGDNAVADNAIVSLGFDYTTQ